MPKYVVRYGAVRLMGVFSSPGDVALPRSAQVIVRTDRGLEAGEVLCEATERALSYLKNPVEGPILRVMSAEDQHELSRIREHARVEFQTCKRLVTESGLDMELVDIEHLFGGERIVVYYLAENRVDFRQLVRTLASEFQTRIEMRQIGVRDEAKLLADFGDCGQAICCNTYLIEMPPVSMKMAKTQKATLDPTKISGRCGRLKCCLRYEYDTYEELQKQLPSVGSRVMTPAGRAKVVGQEILAGQVLVETEDRRRALFPAGDLQPVEDTEPSAPKPKPKPREKDTSRGPRSSNRPEKPNRRGDDRPENTDPKP